MNSTGLPSFVGALTKIRVDRATPGTRLVSNRLSGLQSPAAYENEAYLVDLTYCGP